MDRTNRNKTNENLRALLPFAKAAGDYEPPKHERRLRDTEHVALSLTVGHLREARRAVIKLEEIRLEEEERRVDNDN